MSIKLNILKRDHEKMKQIGGRLLPDGKTWIIPDKIQDINPFMKWLPTREGRFVQKPYFSLRAKCLCWKCKRETPVVALGAKSFQALFYETADNPVWQKAENDQLIFSEIDYLDKGISEVMQANYPFFQQRHSPSVRRKIWGNCCVHCQALQEEDLEYTCGFASPFTPDSIEGAKEIRIIYFKLEFDYYIMSGYISSTLNPDIIH